VGSTEQIRARVELAKAIAAMRSGESTFVEGVRRIVSLRSALGVPTFDPDFMVLVAIDSESDHLPNAHAKLMASDAWLAHSAAEENGLQEQNGPAVLAACERLRARFSGET
jgi:hypothetical protein